MATRLRRDVNRDLSPPAIEVRDVRRVFDGRAVLDGLDLTVRAGEFVAMLGHSGSGKSTVLRALAGLDHGVEGSVRVRPRRAVVFQQPRLLPWKRVLENVTFNLDGPGVTERGRTALGEVGLTARARAWPVTLSGGEAQRAALARALVREPEVLLLDEPFGALDALTRIRMYELLKELCRRHRPAVLFVTHDVDEAILLADRVVVLSGGTIAHSREVSLPTPRARTDEGFAELRGELLEALGVREQVGVE